MATNNKWNVKSVTLDIHEEDLLVSLRYMTLVALNRIEAAHNNNSTRLQQELVDGHPQEAFDLMEEYIDCLKKSCVQLEQIKDLVKERAEPETKPKAEKKTKTAKK